MDDEGKMIQTRYCIFSYYITKVFSSYSFYEHTMYKINFDDMMIMYKKQELGIFWSLW